MDGNVLIEQLSGVMNILIAIFVILMLINFRVVRRYVREMHRNEKGISLLWKTFTKSAAEFFSQLAHVNQDGTYVVSFDQYKKVHRKVRGFGGGIVGIVLIKVILLIVASGVVGHILYFK